MNDSEPKVDEALAVAHGLKPEEYQRFVALIGRTPSFTELGIVSAMWNEHCSYKSSRLHLRKLPTKAPWVIQGPGENAGVIDIGDGDAVIFKMESHNHPSFIEPYQGAATGVGGILRDVFTMGARPVACLDFLRFGAPDHPKTRHLVAGVVAGIGGYGNSFGVPTVGGGFGFNKGYDGNILVNAMAVGVTRADAIFYAKASGIGNPIVYLGSKTGRDGIHGASMASAAFEADAEEKRPTVQVGDPFAEKLLLEACLELMASGAVVAIQDMGAAGLTSSAVEMGAKGDLGVELDLDRLPCREEGMTAYEMMLSESQERMLMVLRPEKEPEAEAIFRKWGLDFAIIGKTTDTRRFVVKHGGAVKADLPIRELGDQAPLYDRPWTPTAKSPVLDAAALRPPVSNRDALLALIGSPDLCCKRWVTEQYDTLILGNTIEGPGGDAAVIRLGDGPKGLALTTDATERYCEADPIEGGKQAVAEAWRNLIAVGARPLALTDNLNFGNPEKPRRWANSSAASRASARRRARSTSRSCRATSRSTTRPRASAFRRLRRSAASASSPTSPKPLRWLSSAPGEAVLLIGGAPGWLGRSAWLATICGRDEGAPPPVDLAAERRNGQFILSLIGDGKASAVHDLSDGGLAVALAEMALGGGIGASIDSGAVVGPAHAFFFGEDQSRYLVTASARDADAIVAAAKQAGVPAARIGATGGDTLRLGAEAPVGLAALSQAHESWLPHFMDGPGGERT